jgi:muconate cycloisomerase
MKVNGVIGAGPAKQVATEVHKQYNSGFRTVKIKCGPDPAGLSGVIQSLSLQYPDLHFRLDANRSWKADQVPGILERFEGLPVEYCEEPCHFNSLEQISHLNNISPVPLALDESIEDITHLRKIIESAAVDIVIIKPMLLGNVLDLIETFTVLDTPIIERVCTTSLESGIGRSSIARLASVIGSGQLAHGLSTGSFLKDDLTVSTPELQNGSIELDKDMPWSMKYGNCHSAKFLKG